MLVQRTSLRSPAPRPRPNCPAVGGRAGDAELRRQSPSAKGATQPRTLEFDQSGNATDPNAGHYLVMDGPPRRASRARSQPLTSVLLALGAVSRDVHVLPRRRWTPTSSPTVSWSRRRPSGSSSTSPSSSLATTTSTRRRGRQRRIILWLEFSANVRRRQRSRSVAPWQQQQPSHIETRNEHHADTTPRNTITDLPQQGYGSSTDRYQQQEVVDRWHVDRPSLCIGGPRDSPTCR